MNSQQSAPPLPTHYEQLGGEAVVRELVEQFYAAMDTLPEAWGIRKMHADDLSLSKEKLFLFLSGWLGGPNLYVERFGPPFLRARHLPFSIGNSESQQWMLCMQQALDTVVTDQKLKARLYNALTALAQHMRNRAEITPD